MQNLSHSPGFPVARFARFARFDKVVKPVARFARFDKVVKPVARFARFARFVKPVKPVAQFAVPAPCRCCWCNCALFLLLLAATCNCVAAEPSVCSRMQALGCHWWLRNASTQMPMVAQECKRSDANGGPRIFAGTKSWRPCANTLGVSRSWSVP